MPAVAEDRVHRDQVAGQPLDLVEDLRARQRQVEGAGQGPRRADHPALPGEDLLDPPLGDVGEAEQPQRLPGRGAVDDQGVEAPALGVALDLKQREELVHAGRDGQLLGADLLDPAARQELRHPVLNRGPVGLHLELGPHLLPPEMGAGRGRLRPQLDLERVGEAVRRVGRDHHRAQSGPRAPPRGCGGDAGLAYAALARVEDRPGRGHRSEPSVIVAIGRTRSRRRATLMPHDRAAAPQAAPRPTWRPPP